MVEWAVALERGGQGRLPQPPTWAETSVRRERAVVVWGKGEPGNRSGLGLEGLQPGVGVGVGVGAAEGGLS